MWEYISQNWWILVFVGLMLFMHRPGGAGCCGGGHEDGQRKPVRVKVSENEDFKNN